jgi:UDP-N-acetyl-D-mannosaminuronic acid dehydrogenase
VGGHCIAVDPWFLVAAAPEQARLIRTAREVNDRMPHRVLERLGQLVPRGGSVAVLGITYKADVDDVRESPALRIAELAVQQGYDVRLCDPHVALETADRLPAPLLPLERAAHAADALVLLVDHTEFKRLDVDLLSGLVRQKAVLDARSMLDPTPWRARGFEVSVLGKGEAANPAGQGVAA